MIMRGSHLVRTVSLRNCRLRLPDLLLRMWPKGVSKLRPGASGLGRPRRESMRSAAVVPVVPNRGLITDRNGEVLAANYSAFTLEVTPSRVKNLDAALDQLDKVIDIQQKDRRRLKRLMEESKNFESLPVKNRLSDEEVARFAVNRYRFPGFEIKARTVCYERVFET